MANIKSIVQHQHNYFNNGDTLDYSFRIEKLQKLKTVLQTHEKEIYDALKQDLNKSVHETFTTEIGFLYSEINIAIENLKKWMTREQVETPITHKGTKSFIYKEPYGVILVISPWNYPLQLALAPTIGAIAAGNCVIIKPSEFAEATSALLYKMINEAFSPHYITVVEGAQKVAEELLSQHFNYIFFTGSSTVGKIVMEQASKHLTPVTLELGGKCPVIVDKDVNIKLAAKRIVWGKFTNAGQTCVAPDFLYVHKKTKVKLIKEMKKYIKKFYSRNPLQNDDYVRLIHRNQFNRMRRFLANGKMIHGGGMDESTLRIEPTLIDSVSWNDPIMQEEIFGPILPIFTFSKLEEVIDKVKTIDRPLALYYFGNLKKAQEKIIREVPFGGGCINDTLYHLANPHLPFGGVEASGMGAYHGKHSFDTFSHQKSVLEQTTTFDIPFRYPGSKLAYKVVKKLMK